MHQPIDRKALAEQLLGTGKKPGPLDAGWVKSEFGISGTSLMNWRKRGIPRDRLDDVLKALRNFLPADAKKPRPDEPDGAMSALLERWDSKKAPPWAEGLTTQIMRAIEGSRKRDIQTAIVEALAEQARLDADAARRGGGKAPRNDTPPAGGARRRPRSSK